MSTELFIVRGPSTPRKIKISGPAHDSSFAVARLESAIEYPFVEGDFSGRVVVDIGAGYGEFSALAVLYGAAEVLAYEPNPVVFNWLSQNLQELEKVTTHNVGIWHETKQSTLLFRRSGSASGSISEVQYDRDHPSGRDREEQRVNLLAFSSLADAVSPNRRLTIKVDAEGAEYVIVDALAPHPIAPRVDLLWVEYHQGVQKLANQIEGLGMNVTVFEKDESMGLIEARR